MRSQRKVCKADIVDLVLVAILLSFIAYVLLVAPGVSPEVLGAFR